MMSRFIPLAVLTLTLCGSSPGAQEVGRYTSEQKQWALGTCAVLTQVNKRSHEQLGGRPPGDAALKANRASLAKWWSVNSRDELMGALKWIDDGGHRKIFDSIVAMPEEQYATAKSRSAENPEGLNQLTAARQYGAPLGRKSLLGWDYARYVSLCGWGYLAGYLTEDEAWSMIMPAAQRLQSTFRSWDELGENYIIGRKFWSLNNTEKTGGQYDDAVKWLQTSPASPWKTHAWALPLKPLAN